MNFTPELAADAGQEESDVAVRSQRRFGFETGAEGRTRTDTEYLAPTVFETVASAISPLRPVTKSNSKADTPSDPGGSSASHFSGSPVSAIRICFVFRYSNFGFWLKWCRGGDLNSDELSPTTPSRWRVYQVPPPRRAGRSGRIRTPDKRFWRPLLYQLSYTPTCLNILSQHPGTLKILTSLFFDRVERD